jgi:hypothetical protein
VAVLFLLPRAGPSGPVVEDEAALHVVAAGNDGTPSALPSHLVLPQRAAWLAAPSMPPLYGAVPSADDAVPVCRSM